MKKEDVMRIFRAKHTEALNPEQEKLYDGLSESIISAIADNEVERGKELEKLAKQLGTFDEEKSAAEIIRGMAVKMDELEKNSKRGISSDDKYALRKMLSDRKDEIIKAKRNAQSGALPWALEFKAKRAASAMMTNATVLTGAAAQNNVNLFEDLDLAVLQYPANFILDAIASRQVAKVPETWRWKEQKAQSDGRIGVVAEGDTKTLTDKAFEFKTTSRKKYAGRIEFTEELEIDFDQLLLEIITMFEDDVIRAWQDGVLDDIVAWASAYSASSLDGMIIKPSVYHVIGAVKAQILAANYTPDVVILNPGDALLAQYLQDANGSQQFIPLDLQYGGLRPFLSNKIDSGKLLVGQQNKAKEQHGNFMLRSGVYGNQFIENEKTIIGEVYSVTRLETISKPSWVYADVETVKNSLLSNPQP